MTALDADKVMDHAEAAARFFRHLVEEGVPVQAAISMAGTYVQSIVLVEIGGEKPDQPWEGV